MGEFWDRNRNFLTQILGGAGAFLVLAVFAVRLGGESDRDRKLRQQLIARGTELQRRAGDRGGFSEGGIRELEKALAARIADVCVSLPSELPAERLPTQFLKEKEQACATISQLADRHSVGIKVSLSAVDFHERDSDGVDKYEEHWSALAAFKRLLEAAIEAGVSEVLSIVVEGGRIEPLAEEPEWAIGRYGVTAEIVGPFKSFVSLYGNVNRPGKLLVLETTSLRRRIAGSDDLVQGTVSGWGIRLVRTPARARPGPSEPGGQRFKR